MELDGLCGLLLGLVLAIAAGWATLVVGGRTDAAGRMGLALGAAVFALVSIGWKRGQHDERSCGRRALVFLDRLDVHGDLP